MAINQYNRANERARAVWAYVSVPGQEQAPVRTIATALTIPWSSVQYALQRLYRLGYIGHTRHQTRDRVIRVRFGGLVA